MSDNLSLLLIVFRIQWLFIEFKFNTYNITVAYSMTRYTRYLLYSRAVVLFPCFMLEIRFMKLPVFPGCPGNPSAPGNPGSLDYYKNHLVIQLIQELWKDLYIFLDEVGCTYRFDCSVNTYMHLMILLFSFKFDQCLYFILNNM